MTTVINNPGDSTDSNGITGIVLGILLILVIVVVFIYVWPMIQPQKAPTEAPKNDSVDINVTLPENKQEN